MTDDAMTPREPDPADLRARLRYDVAAAFAAGFRRAMAEFEIDTGSWTVDDDPDCANIVPYAEAYAKAHDPVRHLDAHRAKTPQQDEVTDEVVERACAAAWSAWPLMVKDHDVALTEVPECRLQMRRALEAALAHRAKTVRADDDALAHELDVLRRDLAAHDFDFDHTWDGLLRRAAARLRAPAARPPLPEIRERIARAVHLAIRYETPPDEYVGPCYDQADAVLAVLREMGIEI